MAMWNPWRGCHRYSEGCRFCYIHKGDLKRGVDTDCVIRTERFFAPIERKKSGEYKIKSGQLVYLCFSTDYFIEDADIWRNDCWRMIKERTDLRFLFLTKRIERFYDCIPADWEDGYENVIIGCTIENQKTAEARLSFFADLPIKHKNIICQPLLERIDISSYLNNIELVVVGGESDKAARPLDYNWVLDIRNQCKQKDTHFEFRQCGTHFIKDGKLYNLKTKDLCQLAKRAHINF